MVTVFMEIPSPVHFSTCIDVPMVARKRSAMPVLSLLALVMFGLIAELGAQTPVVTAIHQFAVLTAGGSNSQSTLITGSDGCFYGTTIAGGANNTGTVFKISPFGALTYVHSFSAVNGSGFNGDGAFPYAGLVQGDDGGYYGTTNAGGAHGTGAVFKVGNTDGGSPYANLLQGSDGSLYGTSSGDDTNGAGTLFKITLAGAFTTLHDFGIGIEDHGSGPHGALLQTSDGTFYGMAEFGGAASEGTIFKLTPAGVVATLHNFSLPDANGFNSDGREPQGALIQGADGLYGMAYLGGAANRGTIFKITTAGVLTTLHSFSAVDANGFNSDGANPVSALVLGTDGSFYGTASAGGSAANGTIFKITAGGSLMTLHNFSALSGTKTNSDGAGPYASLLLGHDGNFTVRPMSAARTEPARPSRSHRAECLPSSTPSAPWMPTGRTPTATSPLAP